MNSNFSCYANINNLQLSDRNLNIDWQFGVFKIGKDIGYDSWKM